MVAARRLRGLPARRPIIEDERQSEEVEIATWGNARQRYQGERTRRPGQIPARTVPVPEIGLDQISG
jgi:hypothetical protein